MKIILLRDLTGRLLGGILKGLLNGRFKGLFTRTPVIAALFLTAVVAACAGPKSSGPTPADCMFAEDAGGSTDCKFLALPKVFDYATTYNITVGEVLAGQEVNTEKLGLSNFTFTQIINGNISDPKSGAAPLSGNQLTLEANATALNLTIIDIDDDVFGNFYIELVKSDDASVKVRYTITITAVNDAPVFEAVRGSEDQFTPAAGSTPTRYRFAGIPLNSFIGYSVGNVSASDAENNTVTYSIENEDIYPLFLINPMTGEITLRALADAEALYTFNVIATDDKGGSTRTDITVSVLPDNQAPVFSAPSYTFTGILHNSPLGYSVGNVSVTDPDLDTITYSISGEDDDIALFNISSTGEITLIAEATVGVYAFNVNATDGNNGIATATIFVTVIDGTAPVFVGAPYSFDLSLAMANAAGVVVGNISAVDNERTLFDYNLVGNGNLFGLAPADNADSTRNIITTIAATLSDFAASSITFLVVATHQDGRLSSPVSTITVNLISDSDADGINDFYDSFPFNGAMNVTGSGEPNDPYNITNIYQLQAIAGVDHTGTALDSSDFTNNGFLYGTDAADQLTKHYELANDIGASATNTTIWRNTAVAAVGTDNFIGRGWTPIAGRDGESFSGSFNGEGYAINSLRILARQGDNSKHFGLFGINNGNITAVGLQNINMIIQAEGNNYQGTTTVGNIVGEGAHAGGLVALNQEDGIISYSYTTGLVNASMDSIGGLVGLNQGEISYSYSTATVQGAGDTGGLVGTNEGGALLSSYATGDVRGSYGITDRMGTAGGLAGSISGEGAIINTSYATGMVSDVTFGSDALGGIVGERDDTREGRGNVIIISSYWDNDTIWDSDTQSPPNGVGKDRVSDSNPGDQTGTTPLTRDQLQGCQLDATPIAGVDPVPDCTGLFPSSHWGGNVDIPADIIYGWEFNAGKYPSLSAVRPSDFKGFLPSAEEQECHRNGMPLGC